MILPVYTYNHPILREKTAMIEDFTDEVKHLISNMFETMYNADGIGLAANQVGKGLSVIVLDIGFDSPSGNANPMVLINPVIEDYSDNEVESEEGCLSLPGYRDKVVRPDAIQLRFFDKQLTEHCIEANGLLARVIQHEVDHLRGLYFFDRLSGIRRTLSKSKLQRISKGEIEAHYELFSQQQ
jgi:peptide deformylase